MIAALLVAVLAAQDPADTPRQRTYANPIDIDVSTPSAAVPIRQVAPKPDGRAD